MASNRGGQRSIPSDFIRFVVNEVAPKQVLSPAFFFFIIITLLIIISSLLDTHPSLPFEVCDNPDQAVHYHIDGL